MEQYIPKSALAAEIERLRKSFKVISVASPSRDTTLENIAKAALCRQILSFLDTLEVKEVDLIIHTVIAEYCDWLVMNTNLSHDVIEGCRNLMLTVKEEQFKAQKGEHNYYG